ncbi:DUF5716 family protein [Bradyrhizobium sp. CB82]|uniref:Wadjet anti-phage system protein JetA family protein n=1 Tax=Bradyrhizobium sp. CB82 TaxID=3039159 RepID=UPI0024B0EDE9|nr:Wadjet anti-phage system protein JetA family protein [Bradyrhizobium sp. CB82]WFU40777.1 DUF5716 family protein [Bradyrhizobium sp. CB82]
MTVDLYDRLLGSAADYDLVLNRHRLVDIVSTTITQNRDLIVRANDGSDAENGEDAEFDQSYDDGEYARRLVARLTKFGIIESYTDATHLTVLWRFTLEGKRIAKMFSETRRRSANGRQRSIRACRTALESFLRDNNHEYLVDAYEYSTSIFEDVCQVADIFNEHQRQLLTRNYGAAKEAIDDYFLGVGEFQRRGERYLTSDNIHNHASEIIDLTLRIDALHPDTLVLVNQQIALDNPGLDEDAEGAPLHAFITERIRDIVGSTRRTKHEELAQAVGQFSSRFTNLIMRIIRLQSSGNSALLDIATLVRDTDEGQRRELLREVLRAVFPLRTDLIDPAGIALAARAPRRETPVELYTEPPSAEEQLKAAIRSALEEAFAISSTEVVDTIERLVADQGAVDLLDLPVNDARALLLALSAVESVRGMANNRKLDVLARTERRGNGVFEADNFRFVRRT